MDDVLAHAVAALYLGAAFAYGIHFAARRTGLGGLAAWALRAGLAVHTAWLAAQQARLGYLPFARPAEALSFVAWSLVAVYVFIEHRIGDRSMGAFLVPVGFAFQLASILLARAAGEPGPLRDVLKTRWFEAHVATALFSYSAFSVSFAAGVMHSLLCHEIKFHRLGFFFRRLPPLTLLERINHQAMALGFLLLTVGIVIGAIWMNRTYHTFLWRDSKEISALAIWFLYAANLHTRYVLGWRGQRTAVFSVINFAVLLAAFFVTSVVQGAHRF